MLAVLSSMFFKVIGANMPNLQDLEHKFQQELAMRRRPVAVTFLDAIPSGITAFTGSMPSGCSFWRLASEGGAFYTVPADHFNCAVGSYTHNIPLSPEREKETEFRARGSLQLRRRKLHSQHSAFAGTRKRNRANARADVSGRLHQAGRSARNSALGENSCRNCLFPTWRSAR